MRILTVDLQERSYPIYIGQALLDNKDYLIQHIKSKTVVIITNTTVAPLYLSKVEKLLEDYKVISVILPDGEVYKDIKTLTTIYDKLLENQCDRKTTLVALGGGVIGDITGFAAATYQRGVPFIQIPTTLLAQVDSSVGGKTAVNHPLGKNMIGAFYQPRCVIADTYTLNTLEPRQFIAGVAEVIKYGLIYDKAFFEYLVENMDKILDKNPEILAYIIEKSCAIKAEVVAKDELEQGLRAILNLGHTFGHAIEAAQGYGNWLHGEAVGTGMVMAVKFSYLLGNIDKATMERIIALIAYAKLPINPPKNMQIADYKRYMAIDKKVQDGQIRLVLLKSLGQAYITSEYPEAQLDALLTSYI